MNLKTMLESGTQRVIIINLEKAGYYVLKIIQSTKNGIPDVMAFKKDKRKFICFMVEVKRPGDTSVKRADTKPDPLQDWRHREMNAFGMQTFVAVSWEELKEALTQKKYL